MKRTVRVAKSVAKILSPLILSFLILLGAFWFLKANYGGTLAAASLFLGDGTETKPKPINSIFEGYDGSAEQKDVIDGNDIRFPKRGELYARLSIASCGIEDDVYFDDDSKSLRQGLGQYYGSSIPGYGEPILISGHNNRAFHRLGEVQSGDIVTITTSYGVFEYEIRETVIRKASEFSAEELYQDREVLILYTCYPFTTLSLTARRFFVYAEKISGPVVLH